MKIRSLWPVVWLLVPRIAAAAPPPASLGFEDAVKMSDRIIVGTVQGTGNGSVRLANGAEIALGIKDPATGLVFTPYRIRIDACLFDRDESCQLGDSEVLIPGGTVYETVNGEQRLRTWEVKGAAGAPLPPAGADVLLFMAKRNDRYLPLNDGGARVRVDHRAGSASVVLHFASPRFLSVEGRESAGARVVAGKPAAARPEFIESVRLDRLKALIALARQVPKPTSGNLHAIFDRADAYAAHTERQRGPRVCAGSVSERRDSALGLRNDPGSTHGPDDRRWPPGP